MENVGLCKCPFFPETVSPFLHIAAVLKYFRCKIAPSEFALLRFLVSNREISIIDQIFVLYDTRCHGLRVQVEHLGFLKYIKLVHYTNAVILIKFRSAGALRKISGRILILPRKCLEFICRVEIGYISVKTIRIISAVHKVHLKIRRQACFNDVVKLHFQIGFDLHSRNTLSNLLRVATSSFGNNLLILNQTLTVIVIEIIGI